MRDGENWKAYDLRRSGEEREFCGKIVTKNFTPKEQRASASLWITLSFPIKVKPPI
jgi:hypothetical protein